MSLFRCYRRGLITAGLAELVSVAIVPPVFRIEPPAMNIDRLLRRGAGRAGWRRIASLLAFSAARVGIDVPGELYPVKYTLAGFAVPLAYVFHRLFLCCFRVRLPALRAARRCCLALQRCLP